MQVTQQGENYEEVDDINEDLETEGDADTTSKVGSIMGIPVKFLIIGGAVALIFILLVVVLGSRSSGSDDAIIPAQQPTQQQVPQTTMQPTTYDWYDVTGMYIGQSIGNSEGIPINLGTVPQGTITASGTTVLHTDAGDSCMANLFNAQVTQDVPPTGDTSTGTSVGSYTEDQIIELRKFGYTGDEIELAALNNLSYDKLVEDAKTLHDQEAIESLTRMSDHESEEFQYLLRWSIFHFPYREFTPRNDEPIGYNMEGSYLVNADYEKVDTYGLQLQIKVKIANDTYVYMNMTPERWETLPDTGNIVVRVFYVRYGTEESNQVYVTNLVEQDITAITVNPEDSTVNFEDMTALE